MKVSELFKAHEDGFTLECIKGGGRGGWAPVVPEEMAHGDRLHNLVTYPGNWVIVKPKKKIKFCTFEDNCGTLWLTRKYSVDYYSREKLYTHHPEFDIEKEVEDK